MWQNTINCVHHFSKLQIFFTFFPHDNMSCGEVLHIRNNQRLAIMPFFTFLKTPRPHLVSLQCGKRNRGGVSLRWSAVFFLHLFSPVFSNDSPNQKESGESKVALIGSFFFTDILYKVHIDCKVVPWRYTNQMRAFTTIAINSVGWIYNWIKNL